MVSLMMRCGICDALTREDCTCDWVVRVVPSNTVIWARHRARASHGDFIRPMELTVYGWTAKSAERRIRRAVRRAEEKRLRKAQVTEFRIERSKP